jgi:ribosome-binding protein aMBF1 (putative translation factor)
MASVLAQKVTGSCRLCAACSAVTKTGYLVKRGGAELFVCQSCLTAKFGTDYQLVRSLEPEPPRPVARPRPVVVPVRSSPAPTRLSGPPAQRPAETGCCGSWRPSSIRA